MKGKISSSWNTKLLDILDDRICDKAIEYGLPTHSPAYRTELARGRIKVLRGIWRDAQPKVDPEGYVESAEDLEARLLQKDMRMKKNARKRER